MLEVIFTLSILSSGSAFLLAQQRLCLGCWPAKILYEIREVARGEVNNARNIKKVSTQWLSSLLAHNNNDDGREQRSQHARNCGRLWLRSAVPPITDHRSGVNLAAKTVGERQRPERPAGTIAQTVGLSVVRVPWENPKIIVAHVEALALIRVWFKETTPLDKWLIPGKRTSQPGGHYVTFGLLPHRHLLLLLRTGLWKRPRGSCHTLLAKVMAKCEQTGQLHALAFAYRSDFCGKWQVLLLQRGENPQASCHKNQSNVQNFCGLFQRQTGTIFQTNEGATTEVPGAKLFPYFGWGLWDCRLSARCPAGEGSRLLCYSHSPMHSNRIICLGWL